jgi:hypothetical protein
MLLLGKVAITVACCVLMYGLLEANAAYQQGGLDELSSPMVPVLLCFMVSYFISTSFMNVYGMTVDSLLLCYCEDKAVNKEGQYYMSDQLCRAIRVKPSDKPAAAGDGDGDGDGSGGDKESSGGAAAKKQTASKAKPLKAQSKTSVTNTKVEEFDAADIF